jgi:hypothetical protein
MKLSALFGMMMFALLEVVRSQFARSYGAEAKDSLEYVLLVSLSLLLLHLVYPDLD